MPDTPIDGTGLSTGGGTRKPILAGIGLFRCIGRSARADGERLRGLAPLRMYFRH